MTKTLALLAATTALAATIALPVPGRALSASDFLHHPFGSLAQVGRNTVSFLHHEDDDDDHGSVRRRQRHDDDDGACGGDDDDHASQPCTTTTAPASTTPPQNGLFGNGTPPRVRVN